MTRGSIIIIFEAFDDVGCGNVQTMFLSGTLKNEVEGLFAGLSRMFDRLDRTMLANNQLVDDHWDENGKVLLGQTRVFYSRNIAIAGHVTPIMHRSAADADVSFNNYYLSTINSQIFSLKSLFYQIIL